MAGVLDQYRAKFRQTYGLSGSELERGRVGSMSAPRPVDPSAIEDYVRMAPVPLGDSSAAGLGSRWAPTGGWNQNFERGLQQAHAYSQARGAGIGHGQNPGAYASSWTMRGRLAGVPRPQPQAMPEAGLAPAPSSVDLGRSRQIGSAMSMARTRAFEDWVRNAVNNDPRNFRGAIQREPLQPPIADFGGRRKVFAGAAGWVDLPDDEVAAQDLVNRARSALERQAREAPSADVMAERRQAVANQRSADKALSHELRMQDAMARGDARRARIEARNIGPQFNPLAAALAQDPAAAVRLAGINAQTALGMAQLNQQGIIAQNQLNMEGRRVDMEGRRVDQEGRRIDSDVQTNASAAEMNRARIEEMKRAGIRDDQRATSDVEQSAAAADLARAQAEDLRRGPKPDARAKSTFAELLAQDPTLSNPATQQAARDAGEDPKQFQQQAGNRNAGQWLSQFEDDPNAASSAVEQLIRNTKPEQAMDVYAQGITIDVLRQQMLQLAGRATSMMDRLSGNEEDGRPKNYYQRIDEIGRLARNMPGWTDDMASQFPVGQDARSHPVFGNIRARIEGLNLPARNRSSAPAISGFEFSQPSF